MNKILDYLLLPFTLWLASLIRFHTVLFEAREFYLLFASLMAWMVASSMMHIYSGDEKQGSFYRRITTMIVFFFLMTGLSFYAHNELQFSRVVLVLFTLLQCTLPLIARTILYSLFAHSRHETRYESLIVGSGPFFESIVHEYTSKKKTFSTSTHEELNESSLRRMKRDNSIQEIILTTSRDRVFNDQVIELSRSLGIRCQIIADNHTVTSFPIKAETIGARTHFRPLVNRLERHDNRIAKRIFDIIGSLFLITVISPILILVAILIKISSPSEPIVFLQERTGYNQKLFNCFKFRSMKTVDRAIADSLQATKSDPRITALGTFIRKTSIDELPQLFNVLRGDMSLVGPRPHPVVMNDLREQIPDYLLRHFVTPGITGWAQVNGWRGPTDTEEKIRNRIECDLWYVENWSIGLDLKILFLTVFSRKTWDGAF